MAAESDSGGTARTGFKHRFFAYINSSASNETYERTVEVYKKRLFGNLSGTVLEIGPGNGANFAYYPRGIHWIGIEPNVYMHDDLKRRAQQYGFAPDIRTLAAERLDAADNSLDAVVSTLVLCSVDNQAGVFKEILRVLRPGGKFVFIEHVAAPEGSGQRRRQQWIQPIWGAVSGGCHVNRDTEAAIRSAGFAEVNVERFHVAVPIASPHIAGYAIKR